MNGIALHTASENGYVEIIEVLLVNGAEVDARNVENRTPLHLSCYYGHSGVAEKLLIHGANIHSRNSRNFTALQFVLFSFFLSFN